MKTTVPLRLAVLVIVLLAGMRKSEAITCLPIVNGSINVDGVVVGTAISADQNRPQVARPMPVGPGSPPEISFAVFAPAMDTHTATLFLASHASGGNLDHLYLGVHIEADDTLSEADRVVIYFHANKSASFDANDFALEYHVALSPRP